MLNEETSRQLREIGFDEIKDALEEQRSVKEYLSLPFEERLALLIEYVYNAKMHKKIHRLVRCAKFRFVDADKNGLIYEGRNLDRNLILSVLTCQFVEDAATVVLEGFTGSGKTYLSCAIGKAACEHKLRVLYLRLPDLLGKMAEKNVMPGGRRRYIDRLANHQLLILDEWLARPLTQDERAFLFDLIEKRYGASSTIVCTQHPVEEWAEILGNDTMADSIVDRLVQNSIRINMGTANIRQVLSPHPLKRNRKDS